MALYGMIHDVVIREFLFVDDACHDRGERNSDVVRLLITQTRGERSLRISVDQQYFLSMSGKSDAEIRHDRTFSDSSLLVRYGYDLIPVIQSASL